LDRNKARRRPVHSDWIIRPEGVIPPFAPPPDTGRVRVAYHLRNNAWVYEPLERDRVPGRAIGANGSGDWAYDPDFAGGTYRDEAPGGGIVTPGAGSAGYGHGQRPLEGGLLGAEIQDTVKQAVVLAGEAKAREDEGLLMMESRRETKFPNVVIEQAKLYTS
jgi:hypothetical protein